MRHPPAAEQHLQQYEDHAHQQAHCVAAAGVQAESPAVEQQGTDDRLTEVVREAHLAIRGNDDQPFAPRRGVIEQGRAAHEEECHGEIPPHGELDIQ